jgi:hypothetical protein
MSAVVTELDEQNVERLPSLRRRLTGLVIRPSDVLIGQPDGL